MSFELGVKERVMAPSSCCWEWWMDYLGRYASFGSSLSIWFWSITTWWWVLVFRVGRGSKGGQLIWCYACQEWEPCGTWTYLLQDTMAKKKIVIATRCNHLFLQCRNLCLIWYCQFFKPSHNRKLLVEKKWFSIMYPCNRFPIFCSIRLVVNCNELPTKRLEHVQQ
jgi:hypothetical protein